MKRRDVLAIGAALAATPALAAEQPVSAAAAVAEAMKNKDLRPYRSQIEGAMACLDLFMKGFNAKDADLYNQAFNFPSVRLASNRLRLINKADQTSALFENLEKTGWDHSAWRRRRVFQAGPDKVHIDTNFARYRKDGTILGGYDSVYVVNLEDGHWGVKIRSSFAP